MATVHVVIVNSGGTLGDLEFRHEGGKVSWASASYGLWHLPGPLLDSMALQIEGGATEGYLEDSQTWHVCRGCATCSSAPQYSSPQP